MGTRRRSRPLPVQRPVSRSIEQIACCAGSPETDPACTSVDTTSSASMTTNCGRTCATAGWSVRGPVNASPTSAATSSTTAARTNPSTTSAHKRIEPCGSASPDSTGPPGRSLVCRRFFSLTVSGAAQCSLPTRRPDGRDAPASKALDRVRRPPPTATDGGVLCHVDTNANECVDGTCTARNSVNGEAPEWSGASPIDRRLAACRSGLEIVGAPADLVTSGAENPQDGSDDEQHSADRPEQPDAG